jgi:hypothetical protein
MSLRTAGNYEVDKAVIMGKKYQATRGNLRFVRHPRITNPKEFYKTATLETLPVTFQ